MILVMKRRRSSPSASTAVSHHTLCSEQTQDSVLYRLTTQVRQHAVAQRHRCERTLPHVDWQRTINMTVPIKESKYNLPLALLLTPGNGNISVFQHVLMIISMLFHFCFTIFSLLFQYYLKCCSLTQSPVFVPSINVFHQIQGHFMFIPCTRQVNPRGSDDFGCSDAVTFCRCVHRAGSK